MQGGKEEGFYSRYMWVVEGRICYLHSDVQRQKRAEEEQNAGGPLVKSNSMLKMIPKILDTESR